MATFETPPAPGSGFPVANKVLSGTSAGETFTGGSGNDAIDGGGGTDTVVFTGNRADYTVTKTATGWTVSSTADGSDTLTNVERLKFVDSNFALDVSGAAGQAYRIYQAAFNRVPDSAGLGSWIYVMDQGWTLNAVAQGFVNSDEFKKLYASSVTNAQIVSKMYENVLHRTPDPDGYAFWVGVLDRGAATVAEVLAGIGESGENQTALVGVIGNGFSYTPFGG